MFVTTGLWDSQVQYYEPAKWVARLRALKTDTNPLVFKINMEAGHGGKSGRFERLSRSGGGVCVFCGSVAEGAALQSDKVMSALRRRSVPH